MGACSTGCALLRFCDFAILRSKGSFLSRVESHLDAANRVIVTLAEISADNPALPRPIAYDIDRIVEKELGISDAALLAEMNRLHEHVWEIFESVQTPKLESVLQGLMR